MGTPISERAVASPTSPTSQPSDKHLPLVPASQSPNQTSVNPPSPPVLDLSRANTIPGAFEDVSPTSEPPPKPPTPVPEPEKGKQKEKKPKKVKVIKEAPIKRLSHKVGSWGQKLKRPSNALARKMGAERFFPSPLNEECDKAARILNRFCRDGVYIDPEPINESKGGKKKKTKKTKKTTKPPRRLVKVPPHAVAAAQGLAIFSTLRTALLLGSASTGSGVLVARLPDGSWSPPSAISLTTPPLPLVTGGLGMGFEIYECVVVINTKEALNSFTRPRLSVGVSADFALGRRGGGLAVDRNAPVDFSLEDYRKRKEDEMKRTRMVELVPRRGVYLLPPYENDPDFTPEPFANTLAAQSHGPRVNDTTLIEELPPVDNNACWSYVNSRGLFLGAFPTATIFTERKEANAAFYGQPVSAEEIVAGKVPEEGPDLMWPVGANNLFLALEEADIRPRRQTNVQTGQSTSAIDVVEATLPNGAPVHVFETGLADDNQTASIDSRDALIEDSGEVQEVVEAPRASPRASPKGKEIMVPSPSVIGIEEERGDGGYFPLVTENPRQASMVDGQLRPGAGYVKMGY